jgi:hypothetical protein
MPFSEKVLDLIHGPTGVAAELPARRPGHRRFITIVQLQPFDPGTPEHASRPKTYEYSVYEVDAARTDEDVQPEDLHDREGRCVDTLDELESIARRFVSLDAFVELRKVGSPW